jgi:topoisomerase-4 subunit B
MNTGGKYDTRAFKKSVGLNGVGTKAVNALSSYFRVESTRDGQSKAAEFKTGELINEEFIEQTNNRKGTKVTFTPDETIFKKYRFRNISKECCEIMCI